MVGSGPGHLALAGGGSTKVAGVAAHQVRSRSAVRAAARASPPAPLPSLPIGTAPDARQPRQPSSSRRPQERDGQGPSRPWFAGDDPSRPTDHLPRPGPDRRRLTGLPLPNHRDPLTGGTPTSPTTDLPTCPGNDPGNSDRCRPAQQRRADPDRPTGRAQAPSPRGGRRLEAGAGGRPRGEPRTSPPAAPPHHRTAGLTPARHTRIAATRPWQAALSASKRRNDPLPRATAFRDLQDSLQTRPPVVYLHKRQT